MKDFARKDHTTMDSEESMLLTVFTVTEDEASSKWLCAEYDPMPELYVERASDHDSTSACI
jgi:hypothetical protein